MKIDWNKGLTMLWKQTKKGLFFAVIAIVFFIAFNLFVPDPILKEMSEAPSDMCGKGWMQDAFFCSTPISELSGKVKMLRWAGVLLGYALAACWIFLLVSWLKEAFSEEEH